MTLDQELQQAQNQKMFVCYEAAIERIIRKWGVNNDVTRYINQKTLTQEQFGERIGVTWKK